MPREVTCDESGYEGEKLIDTSTDVFAHAGVDVPDAGAVLAELRTRIRSPATQYKATHLLREKNGAVLRWFLGPAGPVHGRGHVFLVDKAWLVALRLGELLGGDPQQWYRRPPYVLAAANDLLRAKDRPGVVDEFFRVSGLGEGRERAELFRGWLLEDPLVNSVLDPLVPAVVAAVRHWSAGPGEDVVVAHDRQIMLPARRVERLRELCGGRLADVRFLDADGHPQIQVADILAGTVRKIASDELNGRADPGLAALIRPYVDPASIWFGPDRAGRNA